MGDSPKEDTTLLIGGWVVEPTFQTHDYGLTIVLVVVVNHLPGVFYGKHQVAKLLIAEHYSHHHALWQSHPLCMFNCHNIEIINLITCA